MNIRKTTALPYSLARALLVASVILLLSFSSGMAKAATSFCLDDDDLKLVLISEFLQSSGATAGTCMRQFPQIAAMAKDVTDQFQKTYEIGISANDNVVRKILDDHGVSTQDQKKLRDSWTAAGIYQADSYSLEECNNFIMGLKGAAVANNFNFVEMFALNRFNVTRQKVPRCLSKIAP